MWKHRTSKPAKSPSSTEISRIEKELSFLEEKIKNAENLQDEIKIEINKLYGKATRIEQFKAEIEEKSQSAKAIEEEISRKISPDHLKKAEEIFSKLKDKKEKYNQTLQLLNQLNENLSDKKSSFNEKNQEAVRLETNIEGETKRLDEIKKQIAEQKSSLIEKTQGKEPEEIKNETQRGLEALKKKREDYERTIKKLEDEKNSVSLKLQALTTSLEKDKEKGQELFQLLSEKAKEKGVSIEPDEPLKTENLLHETNEKIAHANQTIGALNEQIKNEREQLKEKEELSRGWKRLIKNISIQSY